MKKLLEKWKGIVTLVLVSLSLYSCKDDDNSGISTESIIGVWEGIKADSWSIVPAAEATEGWWGERPDKDSQYGTDISDYRVEFTADMFYRVYTYNEYTDKWSRGAVGKWSVSGNTLTMVSYYSNAYDEENPEIFQIVEQNETKITLEYYKNTPEKEKYSKATFRRIADREDMFEEEETNTSNSDEYPISFPQEHPVKFVGKWKEVEKEEQSPYSILTLKEDGSAALVFYFDNGTQLTEDGYRWTAGDDLFCLDQTDDCGYQIYYIKEFTDDCLVIEYSGYAYNDRFEQGFSQAYPDSKGKIKTYVRYIGE